MDPHHSPFLLHIGRITWCVPAGEGGSMRGLGLHVQEAKSKAKRRLTVGVSPTAFVRQQAASQRSKKQLRHAPVSQSQPSSTTTSIPPTSSTTIPPINLPRRHTMLPTTYKVRRASVEVAGQVSPTTIHPAHALEDERVRIPNPKSLTPTVSLTLTLTLTVTRTRTRTRLTLTLTLLPPQGTCPSAHALEDGWVVPSSGIACGRWR
jgi:hypothetical protein